MLREISSFTLQRNLQLVIVKWEVDVYSFSIWHIVNWCLGSTPIVRSMNTNGAGHEHYMCGVSARRRKMHSKNVCYRDARR